MATGFKQFFEAPVFPDPEKTRRAQVLHRALLAVVSLCSFYMVGCAFGLARSPLRAASIAGVLVLAGLICIPIMRSGRLQLVSVLFSILIWCVIAVSAVLYGGVNSPGYTFFVVGCVSVGFLCGGRAAIYFAGITAVVMLGVLFAGQEGWFEAVGAELIPVSDWLLHSLGLATVSVLIFYSLRSTDDALHEARRNESKAIDAMREVESGRSLLETRARQQASVAELGQIALTEASAADLIKTAVQTVARTLDVKLVMVAEALSGGDGILLRCASEVEGLPEARIEELWSDEQARHTLSVGSAVIVGDLREEKRFSVPPSLLELETMSTASVIIPGAGRSFGVLEVHAAERRLFSSDDIHFMRAVANLIALVIRRAATDQALSESEDQLRQAQKMQAIGLLAGGVAHDVNNLLTVISSCSEMFLEEAHEGTDVHSGSMEILQAVKHGETLTRQLLAFSRKDVRHPEVLDLNETIRELERMLARLIGDNIDVRWELDASIPNVLLDPSQIEQVILNLTVNARDAMENEGVLTFATRLETQWPEDCDEDALLEPRRFVCLSVVDTGCGMDLETQMRVFEPFFTTKGAGRGTGLGLSTVYGIVSQCGGKVTIQSQVGEGTTFDVYLPACDEPSETKPKEMAPKGDLPRGTETILLVEDQDKIRELARSTLEACGYRVLEASDGEAALDLVRRSDREIDVLLTDIVMPRLNGRILAQEVRSLVPRAKIIFISGYADGSNSAGAPLPDHDAYIQKPFKLGDLARHVRRVLDDISVSD